MVHIALPMVISSACYTLMTFTDRMFLSRLGPEVMSAAMAGGVTAFAMITFFSGLTGYVTALVAQYFGADRKDKCSLALTQAIIISLLAYPLILFARPLAYWLFKVMGIAPIQLSYQKLYFDILLLACFVPLARNSLSCFFSGIGRTKVVMISSLTAMIVNIGVNYVLIFGKLGFPALGIKGAAIGTICGGISGVLVLLNAYLSRENRANYGVNKSLRFDREVMGTLIRFGYPAGIEMFLNIFAFDVMIMLFHSVSVTAAAASTIMFNWDMVSFVPLLGIEIGVTSLVGRYMGARTPETAHKAAISGLKMGIIYSAFIFILFAGFPQYLAEFFRPEGPAGVFTSAKPLAIYMIRIASLYVLVEAIMVVFIGALRGAGDTFWAMGISVATHWVPVPLLYLMLKRMNLPAETGWSVLVGIFMLFSCGAYLRYRGGQWKNIVMVSPPVPAMISSPDDHHELTDF